MWALSVSVEKLRPWEFAAMDAHEYYRIVTIQEAWRDGREDARWHAQKAAELEREAAGPSGRGG